MASGLKNTDERNTNSSKMDKAQRKKILHSLAEKDLAEFRMNLPIAEKLFPEFLDFIDEKLSGQECKNDFSITNTFCKKEDIDKEILVKWLKEQGIYCDCEVLNLEDCFEYLNPPLQKSVSQPQVQKQKLSALKTSFGFYMDKIPAPWVLTETVLNNETTYTFQIGKKSDCLITLEDHFPLGNLDNDDYWKNLWIKETELDYNLDLVVERPDLDHYTCIIVKSKNWTPVLVWCKHKLSEKWFLKMRTEINRYKGDLKELYRFLDNIQVDKQ
ncbi:MAG: DUF2695 domain-containing protein [Daejeonella sp.]